MIHPSSALILWLLERQIFLCTKVVPPYIFAWKNLIILVEVRTPKYMALLWWIISQSVNRLSAKIFELGSFFQNFIIVQSWKRKNQLLNVQIFMEKLPCAITPSSPMIHHHRSSKTQQYNQAMKQSDYSKEIFEFLANYIKKKIYKSIFTNYIKM